MVTAISSLESICNGMRKFLNSYLNSAKSSSLVPSVGGFNRDFKSMNLANSPIMIPGLCVASVLEVPPTISNDVSLSDLVRF